MSSVEMGGPVHDMLAKACRNYSRSLRIAAITLPGLSLSVTFVFSASPNPTLRFIAAYISPGWALGALVCAALLAWFDYPDEDFWHRFRAWLRLMLFSLGLTPFVAWVATAMLAAFESVLL